MKKVTIKDVATKSGTSVRTVSRVINNEPHVKKETLERVRKAIDELGFQVNLAARSLRDKKTRQLVIFIDQRKGRYWGLYHNEFFDELHRYAKSHGYRMLISASSPDSFLEDENDGFNLVRQGFCDGAVIFDPQVGDKRVIYLKESRIPFVLMGKDDGNYTTSYVDLDNRAAGFLAAQVMANNGYEKVTFLTGNKRSIVNQERAFGFRRYCEEKQLNNEIIFGLSGLESVYHQVMHSLSDQKRHAFFISGDERALGVYRAVLEHKKKIGEEIGVLGIDNLEMGKFLVPPLTTIDQPKDQLAEAALQLLIAQIDGETTSKHVVMEPRLIKRRSL